MATMPFGKHKGTPLADVPTDYLEWLLGRDLHGWLEREVKAELVRRTQRQYDDQHQRTYRAYGNGASMPPPLHLKPVVKELLAVGYRMLALKIHPDQGGHHEDMVKLNEAKDWLQKKLLGG